MSILRRFTDFILGHRLQAIGLAFVIAYIPLVGSLSILIAGLVTLRKGALEGSYVLAAATIPYVLSYYVSPPEADQAALIIMALSVIIMSNILIWVYAALLKRYSSWSLLLEISLLLGMTAVIAVHFIYPNIQNWWSEHLAAYFAKKSLLIAQATSQPEIQQAQAINLVKPYLTGFIAVSVLINTLLQIGLARWWETVIFRSVLLRNELKTIRLSYVTGGLTIIVLVLSLWHLPMIVDMTPVFYGLLSLAGLSLIHYILAPIKYNILWLSLIYLATIFLFPESAIILSLFALLDVLLNLRKLSILSIKR